MTIKKLIIKLIKKVLVNINTCHRGWVGLGSFLQVHANVQLNLRHQRRDGYERAAQRLGFQDTFELFELAGVAGVDFGVLCRVLRVLQLSSHVGGFGRAAGDFRYKRVLPHRLVLKRLALKKWLPQGGFIL